MVIIVGVIVVQVDLAALQVRLVCDGMCEVVSATAVVEVN